MVDMVFAVLVFFFFLFSDFYMQCDCDQGQFNIYMYALVQYKTFS